MKAVHPSSRSSFFEQLSFGDHVECYVENDALVVRPLSRVSGKLTVEILRDLVPEFAERSKGVRGVIGALLEKADEVASGKRKSASISNIFGQTDHV